MSQEVGEPIFGARLDSDASEKLAAAMRAAPGRFVAQRRVMPSTVPVIEGDELKPRSLVLRAFVVADGVDGYETMPGALAVVGGAADEIDISIARGARSKDTWVISDGEVSEFSLLRPAAQPVALTRGGGDLPSRVADNFFWLGRYAERAEAIARLARVVCLRLTDRGRRAFAADFAPLVAALRMQTRIASGRADGANGAPRLVGEPDRVVRDALFDTTHEGTLYATAHAIERVARSIRDRLSMDSWSVVVSLQHEVGDGERAGKDERLLTLAARLDRVVMTLTALAGFTSESMTREAAWRFLDMGRRLERALNTAIVIEQALTGVRPDETPVLEALLETADSAMTYRRRYRATLQVAPVVDLLAADEGNPRSILFQLAALAEHVAALPHDPTLARRSAEERIAFEALSAFRLLDVDAVCAADGGLRPALAELCGGLIANMQRLSDALSGSYLAPATVSRSLALAGSWSDVSYRVRHVTEYMYAEGVSTSHHELHLRPRVTPGQVVSDETLTVTPEPAVRRDRVDWFGNVSTHLAIHARHTRLAVTSSFIVDIDARAAARRRRALGGGARLGARGAPTPRRARRSRWRCRRRASRRRPAARAFAAPSFTPGRPLAEVARELMHRIHAEFTYDPKATDVATPVDEVLRGRRGVCQDFAHVQLACLRAFGLAARYVSGYLVTHPPADDRREGAGRRRRLARLGLGAPPGRRLAGPGSDQRRRARPIATSSSPSAATSATSPRCAA